MPKKESNDKKKSKTFIISAIVIGIIILLLLLLLFWSFIRHFFASYQIPNYADMNYSFNGTNAYENYTYDPSKAYNPDSSGPNLPESPYVPESPPSAPDTPNREFKTSSTLSELSFSRNIVDNSVEGIAFDTKVNIVIKGYLQEIDQAANTNLPVYADRLYAFKEGKIEWSINGEEIDTENSDCTFDWTVQGSGNDPANNIYFTYDEVGFYTQKPELALYSKLKLPVTQVEGIEVHKPSENVDAICDDQTSSTSITKQYTSGVALPLIIRNIDLNQKAYSGNLEAPEDNMDTPENAPASFEEGSIDIPLNVPYDVGPWEVTWKVYLP